MNKLKKTIDSLRAYLGRDGQGIALLNDVSKAASEQRQSFAVLREHCDTMKLANEQKTQELERSHSVIEGLRVEVDKNKSLLSQQARKLSEYQIEIDKLQLYIKRMNPDVLVASEDLVSEDKLAVLSNFASTFNTLKREIGRCPKPTGTHKGRIEGQVFYEYELRDFATAYSTASLLNLGRFVACLAMLNFPATIITQNTLIKSGSLGPIKGDSKAKDTHIGKFMRWFSHNVNWERPKLGAENLDTYDKLRQMRYGYTDDTASRIF